MDTRTRRRFLRASRVPRASALADGARTVGLRRLLRSGVEQPGQARRPVLVVVTLYGGNDGLSTVVPYTDGRYHDARAALAYDESEVLPLGEELGLNASMTGLHRLWRAGRLAVVRGVGYPDHDRSHFRSMDIWQSASPGRPKETGWLGRWLDTTDNDPLRAVSIGNVLPPMLVGDLTAGAAIPLAGLTRPPGIAQRTLALLGEPGAQDPPVQAQVAASIGDLASLAAAVGEPLAAAAAGAAGDAGDAGDAQQGPGTVLLRPNALAEQLGIVATCIEARLVTQVYEVSLGGFDTHAAAKAAQTGLLGQVDQAVSSFVDRLAGHEVDVTVMIYSEFGRRVRTNGSHGTDHGTAGPVLVAGTSVRGGFYGEQPDLADLDGEDLRSTTDFRSVYATVLANVLGADPRPILGGDHPAVPFLI
ncbi:DUF1501 domain-containing protein [Wenjunlia tyrosinilytica]|uniref:DUF1501 domain-containing protein n=1 Tax=Wenjunlia tyrosinilytica TaxID=1544741 RepID=A0A917ZV87_9ACTN|nr:DUF1501 domain-containing protein [Wenjunlia tyrosinilytica]GGO97103.1 hypothetical protein GCM10012280_58110 [Wenjunlia tyrosinilytica]